MFLQLSAVALPEAPQRTDVAIVLGFEEEKFAQCACP